METQYWERTPYTTRKGIECINSCIYNFLANDNQNLSMSDLFFAGNSFEITYSKDTHKIKSGQNKGNLNFIETFLTESEVDAVIETYDGEMKTFLYEKLSKHSRLILHVSSSNLPYNKAFGSKTMISHFVNVIGYNQESNEIKISDGCAPIIGGGCFEDWINTDALIENWQLMNGEYIELRYDALDCSQIQNQALPNMKKGIEKYLRTDRGIFKSTISGHQGILRLFQDIHAYMQTEEAGTLELVRALNRQLRIEGYLSAKWFLLEKMQENQANPEQISQYEALIQDYDMICLSAMKSVIKKQKNDMTKVIERVKQSVEEEKRLLQDFLKYLN